MAKINDVNKFRAELIANLEEIFNVDYVFKISFDVEEKNEKDLKVRELDDLVRVRSYSKNDEDNDKTGFFYLKVWENGDVTIYKANLEEKCYEAEEFFMPFRERSKTTYMLRIVRELTKLVEM